MKKAKYIAAGFLAVAIVSVGITKYSIAAGSEPGSSGDPVVSKSYVDGKLNELKTLINNGTSNNNNASNTSVSKEEIVSEVLAVVDALYGDKSTDNTNTAQTGQAFVPIQLLKGKFLLAGEGTEIIVRSGKASAYSQNEMGVVDASLGNELFNGANAAINHLLIVARNDGRGVYANEDSWLMVKGSYSIK
jgi:hypothetical protein